LLSQGRLVAVGGAGADQAHGYAYWLVQADATPRDDVKVVIDWIKTEAKSVEMRVKDELTALAGVESAPR
jgi:LysR family transcriptional regulator, glycine cleavage system transcriptional activator